MNTRALDLKIRTQVLKGFEWMGSVFGIVGALMLAANFHYSGYGWLAFLLSNFCWIGYAAITSIKGMLTMQLIFLATSVLGIFRWLS